MISKGVCLFAVMTLGACVAENGPISTQTTQQFQLSGPYVINVTPRGGQVELLYPAAYRLADAEAADFVERATGCLPGALLGNQVSYDGAARRVYALHCG